MTVIKKSMTISEVKEELKDKKYREVMLDSGFSTGIIPGIDPVIIKKGWEGLPLKQSHPFIGCYSPYLTTGKYLVDMKKKWNYYVAYPSMPEWFEEFVTDFNSFYDNISIDLLESKSVFLSYSVESFQDWTATGTRNVKRLTMRYHEKDGEKKVMVPMIRFNYSNEYDSRVKYFFNYTMTILIRMLCLSESFINPFYLPKGNKIKYLVGVNNRNKGYRSFSEENISVKGLKALDDVERLNGLVELVYTNHPRQTDFYEVMANNRAVKSTVLDKKLNPDKYPKPKPKKEVKRRKRAACKCKDCRKMRGEI